MQSRESLVERHPKEQLLCHDRLASELCILKSWPPKSPDLFLPPSIYASWEISPRTASAYQCTQWVNRQCNKTWSIFAWSPHYLHQIISGNLLATAITTGVAKILERILKFTSQSFVILQCISILQNTLLSSDLSRGNKFKTIHHLHKFKGIETSSHSSCLLCCNRRGWTIWEGHSGGCNWNLLPSCFLIQQVIRYESDAGPNKDVIPCKSTLPLILGMSINVSKLYFFYTMCTAGVPIVAHKLWDKCRVGFFS